MMGVAGRKAKCYIHLMWLNIFDNFAKNFSPPIIKHVVSGKFAHLVLIHLHLTHQRVVL